MVDAAGRCGTGFSGANLAAPIGEPAHRNSTRAVSLDLPRASAILATARMMHSSQMM